MKLTKEQILKEIKTYYKFEKDADFARHLDIKPQVLSNWYARNTFDYEIVYTKCLLINPEWLITGKGSMLKNTVEYTPSKEVINTVSEPQRPIVDIFKEKYYSKLEEENELLKKTIQEKDELIEMYKSGKIINVEAKKGVLK